MSKGSSAPTPRAWKRRANRCGAALWSSWQRIGAAKTSSGGSRAPAHVPASRGRPGFARISATPACCGSRAETAPAALASRKRRAASGGGVSSAREESPGRAARPGGAPPAKSEAPPTLRVVRGASVAPRDPLRVPLREPGARYGLARPRAGRDPRGPRRSYLRAARAPGARGRGPGLLAQSRRTSRRARPRGRAAPENRGCALRNLDASSIYTY